MKFFSQLIGSLAVIYTIILIAVYFFQNKMLFFPDGRQFGRCKEMESLGSKAVRKDGLRYYLYEKAGLTNWVIIFHGNAGSACDRTYFLELLESLSLNMVFFEYPGYGRDGQEADEKIILSEALRCIEYFKKNLSEDSSIYLLGESLGTGVATYIASRTTVSGLILISPYTSIADVAKAHYPWLPVKTLIKNRFLADEWAEQTNTPVLGFHGKRDRIIPIRFGRNQVKNFKGPVKFIEIEHAGHNDITIGGRKQIQSEIDSFILKKSDKK